jgi:CubicO group peptidase (beta-lactamase class C family)
LNWTEPLGDGQPLSMLGIERSPDWVKFVLDRPMAASPGTTFNYSSGNAHLLSGILTKSDR